MAKKAKSDAEKLRQMITDAYDAGYERAQRDRFKACIDPMRHKAYIYKRKHKYTPYPGRWL